MTYYLLFILDYGDYVRQKTCLSDFEFKMGCQTAQITCNINNTFGSGAANKCTVQWWFKKFCKGHDSLEDEEHSGWLLEVDNDQLRGSLKLILLHEKLPKLNADQSTVFQH